MNRHEELSNIIALQSDGDRVAAYESMIEKEIEKIRELAKNTLVFDGVSFSPCHVPPSLYGARNMAHKTSAV